MEPKETHLKDYLRVVYRRKRIVAAVFVIAFSVILIGILSRPQVYMASTRVIIEKSEQSGLQPNYYMPYDPEFYETQYQLIKSPAVAKRVVEMLSLDRTYGSYVKGDMKDLSSGLSVEELADMISSGVVVKPVKGSRIVNISYMSGNPELAYLVVNSVAKAYIKEVLEMKTASSRYIIDWLSEKSEEERAKLLRAERALQDYMKANDIVTLENRIALIPQKLSEFGTQLTRAETKKYEMEALYNKVKEAVDLEKAETVPAVSSDPALQALKGHMLKAEQNIIELKSRKYGEKHPVMIRAKEGLKALKEKREQETKRVIESIRNEYELAMTREENLHALLAGAKKEAHDLNEKFIQYKALKRDLESDRELYSVLVKKVKEQGITEHMKDINIWILEEAKKPAYPVNPNTGLNIMFGLVVALLGGVGLAFFVEYLDNTVKSSDETEAKLGVHVLGVVPLLMPKGKPIEGIVESEPRSSCSEMYKAIRTSLLFSSNGGPLKTILIASMEPKEGKTATAVNLAMAISQYKSSVLLIDADLRKPDVHNVFKLDNGRGLSDYLAGDPNIKIHKAMKSLDVITAGGLLPNPSELLGSERMVELLKRLGKKYDIIVIDSPPLMSVTDALILSKVVDGTLVVARAGKTTYEVARKGLKSLSDLNSHVLGIVLNALDLKKSDYYYYRYRDYYSSGKET